MKKLYALLTILAMVGLGLCIPAKAAGTALAKFAETAFDFGDVAEKGDAVSHSFEFTNTGSTNLVIYNAKSDCGCTRAEFPREPIAPGETGVIKVVMTPIYPGAFTKVVTVTTNGDPKVIRLKISGTVIPK